MPVDSFNWFFPDCPGIKGTLNGGGPREGRPSRRGAT